LLLWLVGWEKASDPLAGHQKEANAGLNSSNIDAVKNAFDFGPTVCDGVRSSAADLSVATVEKTGIGGIVEDSEMPQWRRNPDQRIRI